MKDLHFGLEGRAKKRKGGRKGEVREEEKEEEEVTAETGHPQEVSV